MDGRRGYPRVDNGIRGTSTFKEPPTQGWMERDRIRALELNMHGELGREVSTVKPKGLSIVDLDATEFKEVAVKRVSNGITAAKALSRYAARLAPFAQAFLLGTELGDWAYDYLNPGNGPGFSYGEQPLAYLLPGEGLGAPEIPGWTFTSCGRGESKILYVVKDNFGWGCSPTMAELQLSGTPPVTADGSKDIFETRKNYAIGWAQDSFIGPGPNQTRYYAAWIGQRVSGCETTSRTKAEFAQVSDPDVVVMPRPKIDPRVPYDAIPFQGLWSSPFTTRGNSVESAVQRLPSAASASRPGPTHVVELRPDGSGSSTTTTPTKTGYSQPAPRRTKERKFVLRKGGAAGRIFGTVTEIGDFVDCLFSAIPLKQRLRDGVTKRMPKNAKKDRRNPTGGKKFQDVGLYKKGLYVAKHFDTIDIKKALNCIVINEIQDRGIGLANQMANTVTKNPYWVSPRGSGMIAPKF